eukprot:TRINITY_DN112401_c0_g1_i1.p1 TRINITY_DN112401_c0_g1~~TRINITY_DN112401_c0_g1_i1.p1  ORF type:complete len:222 (-),score=22.69 TRINITY_DN112401_c0_g1_i1:899-1564(-)
MGACCVSGRQRGRQRGQSQSREPQFLTSLAAESGSQPLALQRSNPGDDALSFAEDESVPRVKPPKRTSRTTCTLFYLEAGTQSSERRSSSCCSGRPSRPRRADRAQSQASSVRPLPSGSSSDDGLVIVDKHVTFCSDVSDDEPVPPRMSLHERPSSPARRATTDARRNRAYARQSLRGSHYSFKIAAPFCKGGRSAPQLQASQQCEPMPEPEEEHAAVDAS